MSRSRRNAWDSVSSRPWGSVALLATLSILTALLCGGCSSDDPAGKGSGGSAGIASGGGAGSGASASGGNAGTGAAAGAAGSGGTAGDAGAAGSGSSSSGGTAGSGTGGTGAGGAPGCTTPLPTIKIWLVGDSTVATGSGWGDFLQDFLKSAGNAQNRGKSGRSSKSYYEEGDSWWKSANSKAVMKGIMAGDYVLVQFGHNDSKPEAYRYTDPGTAPAYKGTFRDYLELYIKETKAAGAIPVLVTPVSRMSFGSNGTLSRTHGEYPKAMRKVALDNATLLLDLEQRSYETFNALGKTQTLKLYAEDNSTDTTHFPPEKAGGIAKMVADLIGETKGPLACYLK